MKRHFLLIVFSIAGVTMMFKYRSGFHSEGAPGASYKINTQIVNDKHDAEFRKTNQAKLRPEPLGRDQEVNQEILTIYLRQGWTPLEAKRRAKTDEKCLSEREAMRRHDMELGINEDAWRKENELRELAKLLRLGMTTQEATAVLGKPSLGIAPLDKSVLPAQVPTAKYSFAMADLASTKNAPGFGFEWTTIWIYSPDRSMQHSPGARQSFQMLHLDFGDNDHLKNWYWVVPNLVN